MRTTIDKAGRVVIPKELRDLIGLRPGTVEIRVVGSALRVEPIAGEVLVERAGRLVIPPADVPLGDDEVHDLRHGDQR
jgi:AbrB family looped-hinge helix DNA binding protein